MKLGAERGERREHAGCEWNRVTEVDAGVRGCAMQFGNKTMTQEETIWVDGDYGRNEPEMRALYESKRDSVPRSVNIKRVFFNK